MPYIHAAESIKGEVGRAVGRSYGWTRPALGWEAPIPRAGFRQRRGNSRKESEGREASSERRGFEVAVGVARSVRSPVVEWVEGGWD